jgi:plasmid stabilization system protein ParE
MTNRVTIKLTANFERNLADIEQFLTEAEAPQAFDGLDRRVVGTVLPNLERFPELGRPFFNRLSGLRKLPTPLPH